MIRVFENQELNLAMQTIKISSRDSRNERPIDELYFKAKEVAQALGYEDPKSAIQDHVPKEYKKKLSEINVEANRLPFRSQPQSLYLMEPGLYALIFRSHLPAAKEFQRWVFEEVLPSIRKTGKYEFRNAQMFKIENEFDLHRKVVDYIRRFYPRLLFVAGLGELQDTSAKRIKSWQKGYQKGQPDLIITSHHKKYDGFCLEFKTPKGDGVTSEAQRQLLQRYADNGFKVMVSNDYDIITRAISKYCEGLRIPCKYCPNKFKTIETLHSHLDGFHKLDSRSSSP